MFDKVEEVASEAAKSAAAVVAPVGAVSAAGSVSGLSAAGITSGLAALGLGLGMVTGIGVCVVIGAAAYKGTEYLIDSFSDETEESK